MSIEVDFVRTGEALKDLWKYHADLKDEKEKDGR